MRGRDHLRKREEGERGRWGGGQRRGFVGRRDEKESEW